MSEDQPDGRLSSFGGWSAFFVLVTVGTVAFILADSAGSMAGTVIAAVLVVVLQACYWLVARPGLAGVRANGPRSWAYAVVAIVLFTVAAILNPWTALLLFALTPQIFLLLSPRPATVVIIMLNVLPLVGRTLTGTTGRRDLLQDVGTTAFVITFSLFFAARILAISRENEERRRLIVELRERESEVSALSAARGAEAERGRIAREMHDTLAQGFASIVTLGHATQAELDRDPANARRHLEMITATARENLAESRRIIAAQGPARLEGTSLAEALQRTVAAWQDRTGVPARLDISGPATGTGAGTDVVALRLVQESLENVRKHASATKAVVTLTYAGSTVSVAVNDDGTGFDPSTSPTGFGLAGMRARVTEHGGTFELTSLPGGGTSVVAVLPTRSTP